MVNKIKPLISTIVQESYNAYKEKKLEKLELIKGTYNLPIIEQIFEKEKEENYKYYDLLKEKIREHLKIDKE